MRCRSLRHPDSWSCESSALRSVDARDGEHADRSTEALEVELPHRLAGGETLRRREHALRHEDLPVAGRSAEARSQVRDAADRGAVEATLEPDAAERGEALGDPDAEA